ncbi:cupin domain containing protein [Grosmannia clavigera kw1407]|uniref:Cupin domain containing protein n=1 Tax=Grosmannia clavigera (strain kw1407 / UAMH 11150) TaxID=655863 RepID=F0XRL3_GROCL|nr:cupin domain containing protein [Grosmannia clavigera kw1407]EFW99678.1 cupin domain containing protein [Grosmannia clavigera kw1407]
MSLFPHPRRVVTGHDKNGRAIVVADGPVPVMPTPTNDVNLGVLYETHKFPVSNDVWDDPILQRTTDLVNQEGIVLRTVDFKPNKKTMFHRTESLDFGILVKGELVCCLDDGVEVTLRAGDTCVQRGTIHGWDNRTDQPARMFFVLTAATPATIGDLVLRTTGVSRKDVASGGAG